MRENYDRLKLKINRKLFKKMFIIIGDNDKMIELPQDKTLISTLNIPV